VAELVDGRPSAAGPLERALVELARKTCQTPALLTPDDLRPVGALVGDAALDYVLVIGAFHFINRIADLLHVDSEALPEGLRRFEFLRRLSVRVAGGMFTRWNLENREYGRSYEDTVRSIAPVFERAAGGSVGDAFAPVRARPKLIEALQLALEERERSTVPRATLARVHAMVEAALPRSVDEAEGFHARPSDAVDAFTFVGTRYPARTHEAMIAALRATGWDDLGILDLATAIADANQWARIHRLTGLAPGIYYVAMPNARVSASR
jgi:hypothetical protein